MSKVVGVDWVSKRWAGGMLISRCAWDRWYVCSFLSVLSLSPSFSPMVGPIEQKHGCSDLK